MYFDKETREFGLSPADIIARHAHNMSFPVPFEAPERYVLITPADPPEIDPATHKAVPVEPLETEDGYLQQWEVVPLSEEELAQLEAERLAAEQAARDAARVTVTKRQALLALFDMKGIKNEDIEAQISMIPDEVNRYRALVDWQGSAAIESDSPTVLALAAGLNLTEADLFELFGYAETL
ncbi:hypothetical protein [Comamonas squillarum]|uniref:Tail assembly chaperone n=1 Tax=Comamonas squillarum TaxID=2977320 RepID=A0ABY5ZX43_9BURK|nr:hypothetical protein [Comamonas sp. PR12]UXC18567.1 hypothetical protein N4T19_00025 [Comamonas sp. PR12]